jgi:formylglycine-generating enzyme required for sulfatase activity
MNRLLLTLALLALPATAFAADKYALLIGVTTYENAHMNRSPLKYPEADATAVAEMLKSSGYEVKVLIGKQATQKAIEEELTKFEQQGTQDGVVFIGLFGHGVQYGNDAYYCPYDVKVRKVTDAAGKTQFDENGKPRLEPDPAAMTSMGRLLEALNTAGAGNRILIADCCREDPSAARGLKGRAFGSSVKISDLEPGTAAIFSCSNTEQAFEHDDWKHGAFTKAFLDYCSTLGAGSDATVSTMTTPLFRSVESMVKAKEAGKTQRVNPITNGIVDLKIELKSTTPTEMTNSIGMKLKLIPAGEFLMGSPADEAERYDDEGPQHRVRITKSFYMGVTEVTQGQWFSVMKTKPWEGQENVREGDAYPATYVSWADAVEYCGKLSALEGKQYRLPTEAEWEYACRGGKSTSYSFGSDASQLSSYAWWGGIIGDGNAKTEQYAHEVGVKQSNPYGLYDMHGNVWEWCSDWKGEYSSSSVVDPVGPSTGSNRVGRGGGWRSSARGCRSALPFGAPFQRRPVVPLHLPGLPPCPESVWSVAGGGGGRVKPMERSTKCRPGRSERQPRLEEPQRSA